MSKRLQGKRAVVTGGASGIGRGAVIKFAAEGASVAVLDVNLEAAEQVAREAGGKAIAIFANVADESAIEKAIELAPGDPAPHLSLAVSLEAAGRADDAAAQYRTYLQMVPDARDASAVKARIEVLTHNS